MAIRSTGSGVGLGIFGLVLALSASAFAQGAGSTPSDDEEVTAATNGGDEVVTATPSAKKGDGASAGGSTEVKTGGEVAASGDAGSGDAAGSTAPAGAGAPGKDGAAASDGAPAAAEAGTYEVEYEVDPNKRKDIDYGPGKSVTSGLAVGLGFGNAFGNGIGLEVQYYVQLSKLARLVPHFGAGVYLANGTRVAGPDGPIGAGGLMFSYGAKDRLIISGTFGYIDFAPKEEPQRISPTELEIQDDEDIVDFTASVGYERMEHWGGYIRGTVGATVFTQDVAEQTPIRPALTIAAGYKFW